MNFFLRFLLAWNFLSTAIFHARAAEPLRVATFDVAATPPLGTIMAYDPVLRAAPEGVIDPNVALVSFWSANRTVARPGRVASKFPRACFRVPV